MKIATILINGHQIEAENTWSAKEIVRYDGQVVSERRSFWGGSHFFQAREDGSLVNYEVTFTPSLMDRIAIVIRRNGTIIFSSDRRVRPQREVIPVVASSSGSTTVSFGSRDHVRFECPYCNHRNDSTVKFCERCRASI
ncbi:MAG: zinc ribbon domain-containing protein [Candidatus Thorarchaeota archaeon]|jgi:hypothetical protein